MRAKIAGILCIVFFLSIAKGCSTDVCGCVQFDTEVRFNIIDQNGDSLLNPDHPQALTKQDIDLFFIEFGQEVSAHNHFSIVHNESVDRDYIQFDPNLETDGNRPVVHLEFNNTVKDTIKVSINEDDDFSQVTKVWYNGELRWDIDEDRGENPSRYIEIRKEFQE